MSHIILWHILLQRGDFMNNKYNYNNYDLYSAYTPYNTQAKDERLAGGFIFPFLLGGVTGAAIAPSFWNNNRPVYYYPPIAMPYYYPRRWF